MTEVKLVNYLYLLHMTEDLILNLQVVVMTGGMTGDLDTGIPNGIAMI
jgi:hypothetical protein